MPENAVSQSLNQSDGVQGLAPERVQSGSGHRWKSTLGTLSTVVIVFLISRILVVLISVLTARIEEAPVQSGNGLTSIFMRWDSGWYISVVNQGYGMPSSTQAGALSNNFFPLYPLLVRGLHALTGLNLVAAGLLISNLCFIAALFVIHRYVVTIYKNTEIADRAIILVSLWPHSFVYSAVYTESLFLLLLAGSLLALETKRYLTSGLLLALLSALRPNGIIAAAFPFFHLLVNYRSGVFKACFLEPRVLLPCALAPIGLLAYWWFSYLNFGDAFAQASTSRIGWDVYPDFSLSSFHGYLISPFSREILRSWGLILMLILNLLLWRSGRFGDFLAASIFCLPFILTSQPGSFLRYTMVMFPTLAAVAWATRSRPLTWAFTLAGVSGVNAFLVVTWIHEYSIAT